MRVIITIETGPFPEMSDWPDGLTEAQAHRLITRVHDAIQDEELLRTAIQLRAKDLDTGKEIDI